MKNLHKHHKSCHCNLSMCKPKQVFTPSICIPNKSLCMTVGKINSSYYYNHLTASFPGQPGWAGIRKVKPIWILLEQETVSGSGISWAICKSTPRSRQITMPAPPPISFLQAGCPSCRPTNSVKAHKFHLDQLKSVIRTNNKPKPENVSKYNKW